MSRSSLAPRPPEHLGLRATLGAILGGGAAYALGCDGPTCAVAGGLAAVSVRVALVDLKLRIIRDRDVLALLALGLAWTVWSSLDPAPDLAFALLRAVGYAAAFQAIRLTYLRLRGRDGLGLGDVKLAAGAGPLLAVEGFALAVAAAAVAGIVFVHLRTRVRRRPPSRYSYVPLGCSLSLTICGAWLIGLVQS